MAEPAFLTIAEASRLIARRELSPVELTEACLQRIETLDSQLDSFVTAVNHRTRPEVTAEDALAAVDTAMRIVAAMGSQAL